MDNSISVYADKANGIAISAKGEIEIRNTAEAFLFADMMAKARMLPPNVTPMQAAIAIITGRGLGLSPFSAVQNIAVVNNRPTIWGDALIALASASGLIEDEKVEWFTDKDGRRVACRYLVKRKGRTSYYEGEFSLLMAKEGGLLGRPVWRVYTQRMLMNRARAYAIRNAFPDFLIGIGVREEEEDIAYTRERERMATRPAKPKPNADALAAALAAPQEAEATIVLDADADAPEAVSVPDEAIPEGVGMDAQPTEDELL